MARSSRAVASSLSAAGQVELGGGADATGHGGVHQRVERGEAEPLEHPVDVGSGRRPMCRSTNGSGAVELGQGGVIGHGWAPQIGRH